MTKEDLDIPNEELLDHLDLLVDGKLKRAAVMLFYHKPGRIITGCYVKIGKFGEGSDLQYQDTVEGGEGLLPMHFTVPGILKHGDAAFRKSVKLAGNLAQQILSIQCWVMI